MYFCKFKIPLLARFGPVFWNADEKIDIFRRVTPAAQLKSWLRWHLPTVLRALPHKQPKRLSLSLHISPALCAHDTSSSSVIWLSVPKCISPLTASRLSFICKYLYVIVERKEEEKQVFFLLQDKHCPTISLASPLPYQIWLPWLDMASIESDACCLHSWVKGRRGQWAVADGKDGQGWLGTGGSLQGCEAKRTQSQVGRSCWAETVEVQSKP